MMFYKLVNEEINNIFINYFKINKILNNIFVIYMFLFSSFVYIETSNTTSHQVGDEFFTKIVPDGMVI